MTNLEQSHPIRGLELSLMLEGKDRIRHIAWSPDGRTLAVGYLDNSLRFWDMSNGAVRPDYAKHSAPIICAAWSTSGLHIAAFTEDKAIHIWNAETLELQQIIQTDAERIMNLAWSRTGHFINAAITVGRAPGERLLLRSWSFPDGRLNQEVEYPSWDKCHPAMSADRQVLALSLKDGTVQAWDIADFKLIGVFKRELQKIHAVALCESREMLALAVSNSTIQIEHVKQDRMERIYGPEGTVYSLDFSSDGRILAAKSSDGHVHFWNCDKWVRVGILNEPDSGLAEVELKFAPNSLRIATYHTRNTGLRVWDIDYEKLRPVYPGERMITILFLAADPTDSASPLHIRQEAREIEEQLRQGSMRDRFKVHLEMAARPRDISGAMLRLRPQVVHFSGHGTRAGAIVVENNQGEPHPIDTAVLGELFEQFSEHVECVILNACYSQVQAEVITQHIDYVIGMEKAIKDKAAVAFSVGFYQALGEGCEIEEAYKMGRIQMGFEDPQGRNICTLKKKQTPVPQ
jgi:WD40 repeat protein